MRHSKYSGRGNFFSLSSEIFQLGLNAGKLSVYSFLRRCENHRTHRGNHQDRRKAQRESAVHPPVVPRGDRPVL